MDYLKWNATAVTGSLVRKEGLIATAIDSREELIWKARRCVRSHSARWARPSSAGLAASKIERSPILSAHHRV